MLTNTAIRPISLPTNMEYSFRNPDTTSAPYNDGEYVEEQVKTKLE